MSNIIDRYKNLNLPGKLIAIQVTVWLLVQLSRLIHFPWQYWLALDSDFIALLCRPWTLFTYMWMHAALGDDVFHIIFNMMWLWYFGQFFLRYHSNKQLLTVFICGGLLGGLAFLLLSNGYLVGASGAIFALVAAVAVRQPDEPIYLNFFVRIVPIRMKWFALIALALNLMHLTSGSNTGGIICHLGGMLFGVLFELNLRYGWTKKLYQPKPKMQASMGGKRPVGNERTKDRDYQQRQPDQQQRIDAILDKISRSGYDGLSAEEKAFLFDASHRKRNT
ncbi:MAG: rhomboid family intramembrane serine protease [Bacteroidales bacterium]|nr:rhomboid family intramembrane serine protease [Bacteroidales bacterium]